MLSTLFASDSVLEDLQQFTRGRLGRHSPSPLLSLPACKLQNNTGLSGLRADRWRLEMRPTS